MIARIMSKKDVVKQLELLKVECTARSKETDEVLSEEVIALKVAIDCIKQRRKDDVYIIKATVISTLALMFLIMIFWSMC